MSTSSPARATRVPLAGLAQQHLLRTIEQMVECGKLTQEDANLLLEQYAAGSTR